MSTSTKDRLEKMASGFMASRILLTAVELDLFSAIDGKARTADEVADLTHTRAMPLERLLNALVGVKLLTKKRGRFRNTPASIRHLTKDSPEPLTGIMRHRVNMWNNWSRLSSIVRTGRVPARKRTPEQTENFIRGMADIGLASARECIPLLKKELKPAKRLLDVGGGPAVYACEIAQRFPGLTATVLDLPDPLKIARETIRNRGLGKRVKVKAMDILEAESLGRNYDVVLMSNLIHSFKRPVASRIVEKGAKALKKGGRLIVKEFYARREGTAPTFTALFSINMLTAHAGDCFSREEVEAWMKAAGIKPERYAPVAMASGLLVGIKT